MRDATLYRLLDRALRAEAEESVTRLRDHGYPAMSLRFARLLAALDADGTTITDLARRTGITRQAASQQVAELERAGYVRREPSTIDTRAVLVSQTPDGRALLQRAQSVVAEIENDYAAKIGEKRVTQLKELLSALLACLPAARGGLRHAAYPRHPAGGSCSSAPDVRARNSA